MGTLQIFSNNIDDLNILRELAKRMKLKTKITMPDSESGTLQEPLIDYEDTAEGVVEGVKRSLIEVEEAAAGKIKLKALTELLNENRD